MFSPNFSLYTLQGVHWTFFFYRESCLPFLFHSNERKRSNILQEIHLQKSFSSLLSRLLYKRKKKIPLKYFRNERDCCTIPSDFSEWCILKISYSECQTIYRSSRLQARVCVCKRVAKSSKMTELGEYYHLGSWCGFPLTSGKSMKW